MRMGTTAMTGKLKPADDARRLRREEKAGNPTKPADDARRLRREEKAGNPTKAADDARRLRREEKAGNPTKLLRLRCEAMTGNLT
jgi:hypothetical protein